MSEGEHLDSEFYYSSDLSDAEMLWSNAATCMSSSHQKNENEKKKWSYDKMLID